MNILINNFLIILFIIIVFYMSLGTKKKCNNIHYVPIYNNDEVNIQDPSPNINNKNAKRLPQNVSVTNSESVPLYPPIWLSEGF
jgi:hypothetical protein